MWILFIIGKPFSLGNSMISSCCLLEKGRKRRKNDMTSSSYAMWLCHLVISVFWLFHVFFFLLEMLGLLNSTEVIKFFAPADYSVP